MRAGAVASTICSQQLERVGEWYGGTRERLTRTGGIRRGYTPDPSACRRGRPRASPGSSSACSPSRCSGGLPPCRSRARSTALLAAARPALRGGPGAAEARMQRPWWSRFRGGAGRCSSCCARACRCRAEGDGVLEVRSPVAGLLLSREGGASRPGAGRRVLGFTVGAPSTAPLVAVIALAGGRALRSWSRGQRAAATCYCCYRPRSGFGAVEAVIRRVRSDPYHGGGGPC